MWVWVWVWFGLGAGSGWFGPSWFDLGWSEPKVVQTNEEMGLKETNIPRGKGDQLSHIEEEELRLFSHI